MILQVYFSWNAGGGGEEKTFAIRVTERIKKVENPEQIVYEK